MHKKMKGYGDALHYSVFRCHLSPRGRVELVADLTSIIKHDEDRVMIINLGPLDGEVDRRIEFIGVRPEVNSRSAIIV
ncbi:hypothetical protein ASZ90_009020 [hydrocarbon metagenome]|uniref:Crispr-associated protein cas2 n=1 Tax=hydrocarbon metagenome TaxID=938273 RepID=A0A0W8FJY7_9ZZZZ